MLAADRKKREDRKKAAEAEVEALAQPVVAVPEAGETSETSETTD
jgi:hypothetical protein